MKEFNKNCERQYLKTFRKSLFWTMVDFDVYQFLIVSTLVVKQSFQMKEDVFRQADSRKEGDNKETVIHLEELSNIYSHTECTLRCQQHTAQRCKSIQFLEESNLCFLYEETQKCDQFFDRFLPVDDRSWSKIVWHFFYSKIIEISDFCQ